MNEQTISEQLAVLLHEIKETREQATKTNGRLGRLEQSEIDGLVSRAEIKKELEFHTKEDAKTFERFASVQEDHSEKLDAVRQLIWKTSGAIVAASYLLPEIFSKLFH